jgi:hypothetical protein
LVISVVLPEPLQPARPMTRIDIFRRESRAQVLA